MNKISFFSLFVIVLNSCQNTSTFTKHKTKNFSIEIRSDLNETNDLNDDAVFHHRTDGQPQGLPARLHRHRQETRRGSHRGARHRCRQGQPRYRDPRRP